MSRGRGYKKRLPPDKAVPRDGFDEAVLNEVRHLFSKVRSYSAPPGSDWCLPDPNVAFRDLPWTHPPLQALKDSLNEVKNLLSDKDLDVWHQHTCSTNRAGTITSRLREVANAELCTQAWAKFYEILGSFPILPEEALQNGELNSVHLCEAPGAFIAALNHFFRTSELHCDWNWVANTLNPYHEANRSNCTIADDRLIAQTLPWWFFGSDDTGDIMLQKHLFELQEFVRNGRGVDLVTADGSFDCQGDPGEQESLVAPLQYCEAICALLLLGLGGSFVLKMFTLFEHSSVCLLYLLACCFDQVRVFKPGTSKSGNSEVYVVCLGYSGKEKARPLLSKLIRSYGADAPSGGCLFPKSCVPASFLAQHQKVCEFFHGLQVNTIRENLHLFEGTSPDQRGHLDLLRECAAQFYLQRFQVLFLPRKHWVCRGGSGSWTKPCPRKQMGSFNQRMLMQSLEWRQRLAQGPYRSLVEKHLQEVHGDQLVLADPAATECHLSAWYISTGARFPKVCSSTFCDQELLDLFNEALPVSRAPACSGCTAPSPASVLSEICLQNVPSCAVLVADASWKDVRLSANNACQLNFVSGPSCSSASATSLHDGNLTDQRQLVTSLLSALDLLSEGSAMVVPLCSALTRFTACLVLTLRRCFRSISFRVFFDGPPCVLVCTGFSLDDQAIAVLREVLDQTERLEADRQVLQFAPMEDLLRGELPHFLFSLNNAVLRQQLHLLVQEPKVR